MSAPLHPWPNPPAGEQPAAGAAILPRGRYAPLAAELEAAALEQLQASLLGLFAVADEMLLELGERASRADTRRLHLDTLQTLHLQQHRIVRAYLNALTRGFHPLSPREPAAQARSGERPATLAESLEEELALAATAAKADSLHARPIADLSRHLRVLARDQAAPFPVTALAPAQICRAFRLALDAAEVDFHSRLLLYRLFDRWSVPRLGAIYGSLTALLDRHGAHAPPDAANQEQEPH